MREVQWDDLPTKVRKDLCQQAGIRTGCAGRSWEEWLPDAKLRLAKALEEISGGTCSLDPNDWELLEYRQWLAEGMPNEPEIGGSAGIRTE